MKPSWPTLSQQGVYAFVSSIIADVQIVCATLLFTSNETGVMGIVIIYTRLQE